MTPASSFAAPNLSAEKRFPAAKEEEDEGLKAAGVSPGMLAYDLL